MKKLIIFISLLLLMTMFFGFGESTAETVSLEPWLKAKINWKQFEGQSISVLVLPHAYTLILKPYVPIFWYRKDLFDKYGIIVPDTYLPKII